MKTQKKIFMYFINKPFYMKILFTILFVIYGAIISVVSYGVSNYYQTQNTAEKLLENQKKSFEIKSNYLKLKIKSFEDELLALKSSNSFDKYLITRQTQNLDDIFLLILNSSKEISQLRYLDKMGNELVRYDRKNYGATAYRVNKLQNKANRYYFNEIKNTAQNKIWYSKLDLNVEHGVIQKPIVPTLRLGTPIFSNGSFEGMIIMNIFFEETINNFVDSPFFYISLFDKDGEFIHNNIEKDGKIIDNSWSRYLKKDFNLTSYENYIKNLLQDKFINYYVFTKSITNIIPNSDELSVYYEPKLTELEQLQENEKSYIFTVTIIVLFIAVPLAFIISTIPNTLNEELFYTKKRLEEEIKVVDEYVYLSITNKEGIILDVSQAYANLTGFSKEELVGKKHNILRHSETTNETYKELWKTILNKKVWKGELKNLKKDGTIFNAKVLIKPNINEFGDIVTFTAYVQDITYQKEVERISVTDELTKLYNRREFNHIFKRTVDQARRFGNPYSLMIIDIDYFKQYNDTYGHLEGDNALVKVAKVLKDSCKRSTDLAFRLGGEEFAIMYTSNKLEDAKEFAFNISQKVKELEIEHKNSKVHKSLTVSIGLFFKDDVSDFSAEQIFQRADDALYFAKDNGRDQIYVIDSQE